VPPPDARHHRQRASRPAGDQQDQLVPAPRLSSSRPPAATAMARMKAASAGRPAPGGSWPGQGRAPRPRSPPRRPPPVGRLRAPGPGAGGPPPPPAGRGAHGGRGWGRRGWGLASTLPPSRPLRFLRSPRPEPRPRGRRRRRPHHPAADAPPTRESQRDQLSSLGPSPLGHDRRTTLPRVTGARACRTEWSPPRRACGSGRGPTRGSRSGGAGGSPGRRPAGSPPPAPAPPASLMIDSAHAACPPPAKVRARRDHPTPWGLS
jgi:hypothetical protein